MWKSEPQKQTIKELPWVWLPVEQSYLWAKSELRFWFCCWTKTCDRGRVGALTGWLAGHGDIDEWGRRFRWFWIWFSWDWVSSFVLLARSVIFYGRGWLFLIFGASGRWSVCFRWQFLSSSAKDGTSVVWSYVGSKSFSLWSKPGISSVGTLFLYFSGSAKSDVVLANLRGNYRRTRRHLKSLIIFRSISLGSFSFGRLVLLKCVFLISCRLARVLTFSFLRSNHGHYLKSLRLVCCDVSIL